jgi:hypothetical protein
MWFIWHSSDRNQIPDVQLEMLPGLTLNSLVAAIKVPKLINVRPFNLISANLHLNMRTSECGDVRNIPRGHIQFHFELLRDLKNYFPSTGHDRKIYVAMHVNGCAIDLFPE